MVTSFQKIVDTRKGIVDRGIFVDKDIYQQELEQVFGRCWLWVAHESQIPKNNDFVANYMGEDPVLVARDSKGKVHTFLNMCRHRGNRICRSDQGNAPSFMCTYHGWTFATDGKLVGVQGYKEAYFEELDRSQWGLVEARTETYKGLVFATWDNNTPSLIDYLGDSAWYLDLLLDRRAGGTEFVPGVHRWVMHFNWKFGSDNFGGDNYHVPISHGSMIGAGANRPNNQLAQMDKDRFTVAAGNGHCITFGGWAGKDINPMMKMGIGTAQTLNNYLMEHYKELEQRLGTVRAKQGVVGIGTIFPNLTWHTSPTLRVWHPRGPDVTEIWSYCLVDKDAPKETKQAMSVNYVQRFGPSGMMEMDDADNWFFSTQSGKSPRGRKVPLNIQMGIGRSWKNETHPGTLGPIVSEENWRHFYGWWAQMMDAPSWKDVRLDPKVGKY